MSLLGSFIGQKFRPVINGGCLDKCHKSRFNLDKDNLDTATQIKVNTIAFGPKQDKVLLNLEHALNEQDKILVLYYEDLHKRWTFVKNNSESYFVFRQNAMQQVRIDCNNLYIRGCQIESQDKYWVLLGEFFNFVDCWSGKVICAPHKQNHNESKLYQLNSSLKKACKTAKGISIGKSYVRKGLTSLKTLPKDKSLIVKSLSGVRSIVVDEQEFFTWNENNLCNLPVLFQEKVPGNDLRVHIVNKNVYAKICKDKSKTDYRYDKNFNNLLSAFNVEDEVKNFCRKVSEYEDNPLMGIDFIKNKDGYVVLEANPSPGWSAYHECNGIDLDDFMKDLLAELKNA